jgi:HTH-type transcriptional regulator/antitoxin HigA
LAEACAWGGELHLLRTDADVKRFAAEIGIAPGIVVRRTQHDKIWDYNRGYKLKRSRHIVEDNQTPADPD